jgi:hypothetical protein
MKSFKEPMDSNQVKLIVNKWLIEEQYSPRDFKDETATGFTISRGNKNITIGFHKESFDDIMIVGKIGLDYSQQSMFHYTKTKIEFLYDLEMLFTQMNISYRYTSDIENVTIADIEITKTIFFDGLSKHTFFETINTIFNCLKLIERKFNLLGRHLNKS